MNRSNQQDKKGKNGFMYSSVGKFSQAWFPPKDKHIKSQNCALEVKL